MWISCRIRSDSHTLSDAAFRILQLAQANTRVHHVQARDFIVSVRSRDLEPEAVQLQRAHHVINALLIALNVGCLGLFYYAEDPWTHPVLSIADDLEGTNSRGRALVVKSDTGYEELQPLQEHDVYNTVLIFGIVAREDTTVLTGEYCRGLLLLRMNFHLLNFRREAVLCFYRALEHFVAARILGVSKLKNELKDLQRGLRQLSDAEDLIGELATVYRLRSSQVAHSQSAQKELSVDDVMKTKVFLDFVMHKTFKEQANRLMQVRRTA